MREEEREKKERKRVIETADGKKKTFSGLDAHISRGRNAVHPISVYLFHRGIMWKFRTKSSAKFCFPPAPKPRDAVRPAPRGDRPRGRSIESVCGTLSGAAFGLRSRARQSVPVPYIVDVQIIARCFN